MVHEALLRVVEGLAGEEDRLGMLLAHSAGLWVCRSSLSDIIQMPSNVIDDHHTYHMCIVLVHGIVQAVLYTLQPLN